MGRQLIVAFTLLLCACGSGPTDGTPSGALELFLEAMQRSEWDEGALDDAYALLSGDARQALLDRARRTGAVGGRDFEPANMIAQGRFRLLFTPTRMRETIDGDEAIVRVTGPQDQQVDVPMVREPAGWRVVLRLPSLDGVPSAR